MATIKEWLDDLEFNWSTGRIVYQPESEWGQKANGIYIPADHPILHKEFDAGFGGDDAPSVIAEDDNCIYVIGVYDGSSWLSRIHKNLNEYVGTHATNIPFIGGG